MFFINRIPGKSDQRQKNSDIDFDELIQHFAQVQAKHRDVRRKLNFKGRNFRQPMKTKGK